MQRVKLTQDCLTLFQFALAKEKRAKERKRKLEKRQTVLREFDPLHDKTKPKLGVKRSQLLSLVADQNLTKPPHYILLREVGAGALTGYGATVPVGHRLEAAKIVLGSSGLSSRFFVASGMGSSRMFCITFWTAD